MYRLKFAVLVKRYSKKGDNPRLASVGTATTRQLESFGEHLYEWAEDTDGGYGISFTKVKTIGTGLIQVDVRIDNPEQLKPWFDVTMPIHYAHVKAHELAEVVRNLVRHTYTANGTPSLSAQGVDTATTYAMDLHVVQARVIDLEDSSRRRRRRSAAR